MGKKREREWKEAEEKLEEEIQNLKHREREMEATTAQGRRDAAEKAEEERKKWKTALESLQREMKANEKLQEELNNLRVRLAKLEEKDPEEKVPEPRSMTSETLLSEEEEEPDREGEASESEKEEKRLQKGKKKDTVASSRDGPSAFTRTQTTEGKSLQCPIVIDEARAKYIPWQTMDLEGLLRELPSLQEGASKWIREFEDKTQAKRLAIGDLKAVLARSLGSMVFVTCLVQSGNKGDLRKWMEPPSSI